MNNPNNIDSSVFYLLDADYQNKLQNNLCDRIIEEEHLDNLRKWCEENDCYQRW